MTVKILNTKPRGKEEALAQLLREAGYKSVNFPLLEIQSLDNPIFSQLRPDGFDGVFCSSTYGYFLFIQAISQSNLQAWKTKPVYTLSLAAAAAIKRTGGNVRFTPKISSLRGFLDEFQTQSPQKWLHPCSLSTRLNPAAFIEKHLTIANIPCYRPALPESARHRLKENFTRCEGIVFTSGSAVENCFRAASGDGPWLKNWLAGRRIATLGPSASETLERNGIHSYIQAEYPDNAALVAALSRSG